MRSVYDYLFSYLGILFYFVLNPFDTSELFKNCMFNKKLSTEFVYPVSHVTHTKRLSIFTTHPGGYSSIPDPKNSRRHKLAEEA